MKETDFALATCSGVLSVRCGPNLAEVIHEASALLKSETGMPSKNAALVSILRDWLTLHKDELSERSRFLLLFDQEPRSGQF